MLYMQAQCIFCYINPLVGGGDKKQINNNKNQKRLKTDKQLIVQILLIKFSQRAPYQEQGTV